MWSNLGAGTASLKLRQFKSAVCDAFGVILFLRSLWECTLLCRGLREMRFALWDAGVLGLLVFGLCIVGLMGGAWLFGWMWGC